VVFDLFIVNLAIPDLQTDLKASFSEVGWVVAGYAVVFGAFLIVGGRLGDVFGRRLLFRSGMVGFAFASLFCGLATSPLLLILVRMMLGFFAALLFPQVYVLLRVSLDEEGRRRAFGLLGMTLGIAAISGQILGGILVNSDVFGLGWRTIFFINVPISLGGAYLAHLITEAKVHGDMRIDWGGVGLASVGLLLLLFALLNSYENVWWVDLPCLLVSLLCFIGFVIWERVVVERGEEPALDTAVFLDKSFVIGSVVILLIYSTPASLFLCFSMLLQNGFDMSALSAGMSITPMSVGFIAASFAAPKLVVRFGTCIISFGMVLYAVGFFWLCAEVRLSNELDIYSLWYITGMIAFGAGQGISGPPLLNYVIGASHKRFAGTAAGVVSTMQQLGAAFGVALVGLIFSGTYTAFSGKGASKLESYAHAFTVAMNCNAVLVSISALLVAWMARRGGGGI